MPQSSPMNCQKVACWVFFGLLFQFQAVAFNAPADQAAGFSSRIVVSQNVLISEGPFPATVEVVNHTTQDAQVAVQLSGTDGWEVTCRESEGLKPPFPLRKGDRLEIPFTVTPATDSYTSLYPLTARIAVQTTTGEINLRPIAILDVRSLPKRSAEQTVSALCNPLPESPLFLMKAPAHQIDLLMDSGKSIQLPGDWSESEPDTGAFLALDRTVTRLPSPAPAIVLHPPWKKGAGKIRISWIVQLPDLSPITLGTAMSIRDTAANEPPSDGVTFRVLVDGSPVWEEHTASKAWKEVQVDLTSYRGKKIHLAIESDVGPKRDPTCDLSYWRSPWVRAGAIPPQEDHREARRKRADEAKRVLAQVLAKGSKDPGAIQSASLEGVDIYCDETSKLGLAILPGPHGILDAGCAVGIQDRVVGFEGFEVEVEGADPLDFLSGMSAGESRREQSHYQTEIIRERKKHWISLDITPSSGGFKLGWNSDLLISGIANAPFDTTLEAIYAGVGNVMRNVQRAFTLGADGHRLATRHVGAEFANGLSLVIACSNPPDRLLVDPSSNRCSLQSHLTGSFYLVPSATSPFDAALQYRSLAGFQRSPGFERLAGRFSFDLWGGRYRQVAAELEKSAKYGLTDSLVVFHNWQRWGYDYRLPEIYPPNPNFGTLQDFKDLREVCRRHGILFAPHDNYIDLYPDAEGFSYDLVCFSPSGNPVKGWYNEGRKAQAYRFRPDRFMPFLESNLKLIQANFGPDACFVDVFSSIGAFDFHTREGEFHSMLETVGCWNAAFDRIREIQGGQAPQISESGVDWLVGHLDGAQCNHLRVTPGEDSWCTWNIGCEDHERIPWEDAVLHDVFVLQGSGYESRYADKQDPHAHGIYSDDYICSEVLTGHPPMVSAAFSRAVVRKYWLLHDFLKEVGGVPITGVEFADGDIHRQIVSYANGAKVWVNRGSGKWALSGEEVLPPFGFRAKGPATACGIYLLEGKTVESSQSANTWYVDGRGMNSLMLQATGTPATDFGWCITNAGLRAEQLSDGVRVTPLPNSQPEGVSLDLASFSISGEVQLAAEGLDGVITSVDAKREGDTLTWKIDPAQFCYLIRQAPLKR